MKTLNSIICLIITLSTGCMQRHYIAIDPYVPVDPHSFKQTKPIGLEVINARSSNNIAQRSGPDLFFFSPKFTVRSESDLTDIMWQKISAGLFKMGFNPKRSNKMLNKTLKVDIVRLKSKYEEKLTTLNIRVQATLRAHCIDSEANYSKTYSHEKQLTSAPASTFPNENLINNTLSETLKKMFGDRKLISCLAQ